MFAIFRANAWFTVRITYICNFIFNLFLFLQFCLKLLLLYFVFHMSPALHEVLENCMNVACQGLTYNLCPERQRFLYTEAEDSNLYNFKDGVSYSRKQNISLSSQTSFQFQRGPCSSCITWDVMMYLCFLKSVV